MQRRQACVSTKQCLNWLLRNCSPEISQFVTQFFLWKDRFILQESAWFNFCWISIQTIVTPQICDLSSKGNVHVIFIILLKFIYCEKKVKKIHFLVFERYLQVNESINVVLIKFMEIASQHYAFPASSYYSKKLEM